MARDRYPYPPDEFDQADRSNKPVGAHEQPRSTWSKVWPFLLVLIVVPALAFGAIKFLSERNALTPQSEQTPSPASTAPAVSETPAEEETPSASPTPEQTPEPPPVDKTVPVIVYNASGVSRQAAKGAELLTNAGWTNVSAETYPGQNPPADNTVYCASEDLLSSAQDAAKTLGFASAVVDAERAKQGIVAIIADAI